MGKYREATFVCQDCGKVFIHRSAKKYYCSECAEVRRNNSKIRWYLDNTPNAYAPREDHYCVACGITASCRFNEQWYCNKHWLRIYNNGTLEPKKRKINNTYEFDSDCAYIYTAKNDKITIDLEDFDRVKNSSWCIRAAGYAVARINDKIVNMHRLIMNATSDNTVDHINGDKLDNRKANLRFCNQRSNSQNRKSTNKYGISGIFMENNKYKARIMVDRKGINLGSFDNLDDAINARIVAEIKYYGEFSPFVSTNFLSPQ